MLKNYFLERAKNRELVEEAKRIKLRELVDEFGHKITLPPGINIKLPSDLKPIDYSDART